MNSNIKSGSLLICFILIATLTHVFFPINATACDSWKNSSHIECEQIIPCNAVDKIRSDRNHETVLENVQQKQAASDSSVRIPGFKKTVKPKNKGELIVATARTQIGKPYKHASSDPTKGFDCTGLVHWVYGQHGINTPRSTPDLLKIGKKIQPSKLKPGDIVITKHGRSDAPHGLHAGIYTGNGAMIHAPGKNRKVIEVSMKYFVVMEGRRIF